MEREDEGTGVFELRRTAGKKGLPSSALSSVEESGMVDTNTWSGYRWSSYRLLDEIYDHRQVKPSDQCVGEEGTHCNAAESDRVLRGTDVQRHRAGVGVILHALNKASTQDSILVLLAANILIFLLLWAFFRRVAPVLLTLGVVGVATVWLMGAYGWAGLAINTVTLVMPTLVLVICTADCVHLLRHAADLPEALSPRERAVQTVGFLLRPCGVTTLTTALGFVVLGASPMPVVRHLGLFSALGLVFGLVAAVVGCTWGLAYDSVLPVPSDRRGPGERPRRNGRRTAGRSVSSVGANGPVETQKCADRRARPGSPRSKNALRQAKGGD